MLLREAKRPEDSYTMLAQALAKNPDNLALLYDTAMAAERTHRLAEMEKHLRRLIELKPDYAHAYNALGYTFADRNTRLAEALQLIEKAHELSPDDAYILDSLGWVHFRLGNAEARIFFIPGHTKGHMAFWFEESQALFCGDTLFTLGCGRLFEGTPQQMWASLTKLRALPGETLVYCGHEYTESNARFARAIDPGNAALKRRAEAVTAARAKGLATVPGRMEEERATNPFLRADDPQLAAAVGMAGAPPVQVFAEIRRRKDSF